MLAGADCCFNTLYDAPLRKTPLFKCLLCAVLHRVLTTRWGTLNCISLAVFLDAFCCQVPRPRAQACLRQRQIAAWLSDRLVVRLSLAVPRRLVVRTRSRSPFEPSAVSVTLLRLSQELLFFAWSLFQFAPADSWMAFLASCVLSTSCGTWASTSTFSSPSASLPPSHPLSARPPNRRDIHDLPAPELAIPCGRNPVAALFLKLYEWRASGAGRSSWLYEWGAGRSSWL